MRDPENDARVTYTYDAVGNEIEIADGTGLTTYTYDDVYRRLTALIRPASGSPTVMIRQGNATRWLHRPEASLLTVIMPMVPPNRSQPRRGSYDVYVR